MAHGVAESNLASLEGYRPVADRVKARGSECIPIVNRVVFRLSTLFFDRVVFNFITPFLVEQWPAIAVLRRLAPWKM